MSSVVVVGSFVQDLSFSTQSFPAPGETRIGLFKTGPGGKGFNQAVACNRVGVDTVFIGAIGNDSFGKDVRSFIASEKLSAELQVVDDAASGAASIVVNANAENLIVVALGANDHLSAGFIKQHQAHISSSRVVLCQVENNLDATRQTLQTARNAGVTTILNPAPINADIDLELVQLADILVPNETEFSFLMQHLYDTRLPDAYWLTSDEELHGYCRKSGIATVILTLGDKGCFYSSESGEFSRMAAASVTPVDTTGAGDAFNGGLAAGLVHFGGDMQRALQFANVVAGLSTQKQGTAPAMPLQKEVQAFMAG